VKNVTYLAILLIADPTLSSAEAKGHFENPCVTARTVYRPPCAVLRKCSESSQRRAALLTIILTVMMMKKLMQGFPIYKSGRLRLRKTVFTVEFEDITFIPHKPAGNIIK
jgi:hypothetical protein